MEAKHLDSSANVDSDLVGDVHDAVQACDVLKSGVALVLVTDIALERDPAIAHLDVDQVRRDFDVPHESLQGGATDLVILAAVAARHCDLELIVELVDALDLPGAKVSTVPRNVTTPRRADTAISAG
jgi:hypothetical protein